MSIRESAKDAYRKMQSIVKTKEKEINAERDKLEREKSERKKIEKERDKLEKEITEIYNKGVKNIDNTVNKHLEKFLLLNRIETRASGLSILMYDYISNISNTFYDNYFDKTMLSTQLRKSSSQDIYFIVSNLIRSLKKINNSTLLTKHRLIIAIAFEMGIKDYPLLSSSFKTETEKYSYLKQLQDKLIKIPIDIETGSVIGVGLSKNEIETLNENLALFEAVENKLKQLLSEKQQENIIKYNQLVARLKELTGIVDDVYINKLLKDYNNSTGYIFRADAGNGFFKYEIENIENLIKLLSSNKDEIPNIEKHSVPMEDLISFDSPIKDGGKRKKRHIKKFNLY